MWRSKVGHTIQQNNDTTNAEDEWDTDPDFVNSVDEKQQRWGSKTIEGSGRVDSVNINQLREDVKRDDETLKQKQYAESALKTSKPNVQPNGLNLMNKAASKNEIKSQASEDQLQKEKEKEEKLKAENDSIKSLNDETNLDAAAATISASNAATDVKSAPKKDFNKLKAMFEK